ncbi:MAG: protein kinase [Acidobacteriota bacterium]
MADNLKKGKALGHYRILEKIGAGGMGDVYLAQDTRLDRKVALKLLPDRIADDGKRLLRFEREARAASALNHPNILTVHEFGDANGVRFIASEYVHGRTLRERTEAGAIRLIEALEITIQIASALQAAHQAGIVHRDIKPENVMLRDDGYVKVLDFGLAKVFAGPAISSPSDPDDATLVQLHTQAGAVMGTAAYMSPEQARGKPIDARTDIFSLGVVLYEIVTRRQPFTGETINHTIVAILETTPPPITIFDPSVPPELERILARSLAKKTSDRYPSIVHMLSDLRALTKRLEFEAELERTMPPNKSDSSTLMFSSAAVARTPQTDLGNTIAVMPFVNMSRNEDGDYFSDGLAEELLNVLSKIRGLRVAARTSAFSFKGKQSTIGEIGRTLNVGSVLEGSIRMAGKRVRIAVQLVNVEDGYHLWSETYDRVMDDIFAVQDDIAQSVVEELRSRLIGESLSPNDADQVVSEIAAAVRGRADDPEAQRLMLLGRYFLDRLTREDTAKAITYFERALEIDPGYALCWTELGRAYSIEAGRAWIPVAKGFELARDAAKRALELEPDLAEAYSLLARIQATYELDLAGAEASNRRALELAPGSSGVLDVASVLAYKLGHADEALDLGRRVLLQDPLSPAFWHNLGLTCHAAGLLAESEAAFRRALELVPQRIVSGALLGLVLLDDGRTEDALTQAMLEPDEFWRLWCLAIIYHSAGRTAESDDALKQLTERHAAGNDYQIAEVYSMRGETDEAFKWLGRALADRDAGITHAKVNPRFRPIHGDPRWTRLVKDIGFQT